MIKDIERDNKGNITAECFADMSFHLPVKVYVNDDKEYHRILRTEEDIENYFFGALPYVLTTRYEYEG